MEIQQVLPYHTAVGVGWVEVSGTGVCRVLLPAEKPLLEQQKAQGRVSRIAARAVEQLEQYFSGRLRRFDLPLDLGRLTLFQQQVLQCTARIPYGTVLSYRQLAEQAGYPGAARAVGGVMAANNVPVIIPCHRVVASSGAMTGYSGAGGLATKKFLLRMEGVEFNGEKICRNFDSFSQQK